mmetsp:Transcript_4884/g.14860  ORF Transcript_4884/g.14860 Transcript_4884/m.14860 type:complete len:238 (+) Transcript_4884:2370-3083(+)
MFLIHHPSSLQTLTSRICGACWKTMSLGDSSFWESTVTSARTGTQMWPAPLRFHSILESLAALPERAWCYGGRATSVQLHGRALPSGSSTTHILAQSLCSRPGTVSTLASSSSRCCTARPSPSFSGAALCHSLWLISWRSTCSSRSAAIPSHTAHTWASGQQRCCPCRCHSTYFLHFGLIASLQFRDRSSCLRSCTDGSAQFRQGCSRCGPTQTCCRQNKWPTVWHRPTHSTCSCLR